MGSVKNSELSIQASFNLPAASLKAFRITDTKTAFTDRFSAAPDRIFYSLSLRLLQD